MIDAKRNAEFPCTTKNNGHILYFYLSGATPTIDTYIRADLIWELHAELFGHLVRVKRISCSVLLVEEVNLGLEATKCIEEFALTFL